MYPRSASVVVSTRNRVESLAVTLDSLALQEVPSTLCWDVIVVDNAPSREVRALVTRASAPSPVPVRYVSEPCVGLSRARNRGWRESKSEVVAFLDDDTRPSAGWLAGMLAPYEAAEVGAVSGRLLPVLEGQGFGEDTTEWRNEYTFDFGAAGLDASVLCGANMSFRRVALEEIGGFDVLLGRTGTCLLASEEHDALRALLRMGLWRARYSPGALVRHAMPAVALDNALLRKRHYCAGISGVRMDRKERAGRRVFEFLLRHVKLGAWVLRALGTWLGGQRLSLKQSVRLQEFIGYYRELLGGSALACRGCSHQGFRMQSREEASAQRRHSEGTGSSG